MRGAWYLVVHCVSAAPRRASRRQKKRGSGNMSSGSTAELQPASQWKSVRGRGVSAPAAGWSHFLCAPIVFPPAKSALLFLTFASSRYWCFMLNVDVRNFFFCTETKQAEIHPPSLHLPSFRLCVASLVTVLFCTLSIARVVASSWLLTMTCLLCV